MTTQIFFFIFLPFLLISCTKNELESTVECDHTAIGIYNNNDWNTCVKARYQSTERDSIQLRFIKHHEDGFIERLTISSIPFKNKTIEISEEQVSYIILEGGDVDYANYVLDQQMNNILTIESVDSVNNSIKGVLAINFNLSEGDKLILLDDANAERPVDENIVIKDLSFESTIE